MTVFYDPPEDFYASFSQMGLNEYEKEYLTSEFPLNQMHHPLETPNRAGSIMPYYYH